MSRGWMPRRSSSLLISASLRLVDLLRRPIAASGVQFEAFRRILELKLELDLSPRKSSDPRGGGLGLILSAAMIWLSGLLPGVVGLVSKEPALWLGLGQALTQFFVAMLVLGQYGNLLVDSTDIRIVAPLPVSDRTLFAARLTHVAIYVGLLALCSLFFPTLLGLMVFPVHAVLLVYPLATLLSAALVLGLVAAVFGLVLRLFGPTRFQRLTLWIQVAGMTVLFSGMHLFNLLRGQLGFVERLGEDPRLMALLPPVHSLGLYELALGHVTPMNVALALLAVALPLASGLLALQLASRHFVAGLADTGSSAPPRHAGRWPRPPFQRLGELLLRRKEELAGYGFSLALMRRERLFLRGFYPQAAMFLAMGVGMIAPLSRGGGEFGMAQFAPLALYLLVFAVTGGLELLQFSESSQARWIFDALPVEEPARLHGGGIKALLLGGLLPLALAFSVPILWLTGPSALPDLLLAFELVAILTLATCLYVKIDLPFSRAPRLGGDARNLPLVFGLMGAGFAAAVLHLLLRLHPVSLTLGILAALPLVVLGWRRLDGLRPALDGRTPLAKSLALRQARRSLSEPPSPLAGSGGAQ